MYLDFVSQNGLDDRKPYDPRQLQESFQWVKPQIEFWKHDKEAKYYKIRLITANVSMNRNDYTNQKFLNHAASNLAWRPLNLDHDHGLRLPFPMNRLEIGQVSEEGDCIEAVARVMNDAVTRDTGENIQDLIASQMIMHPSIEAFPICVPKWVQGRNVPVCGYRIEEVALLRKGRSIPGDPLSKVFPVPLNEKMSRRMMETLDVTGNVINMKSTVTSMEISPDRGEKSTPNNEVNKRKMSETETETPIEEPATTPVVDHIDPAELECDTLRIRYDSLVTDYKILESKLIGIESGLTSKDIKIAEVEQERDLLVRKLHAEKIKTEKATAELNRQSADQKNEIATLKEEIDIKRRENSDVRGKISGLNEKITALKAELDVVREDREKQEKDLQHIRGRYSALETTYDSMRKDLYKLREDNAVQNQRTLTATREMAKIQQQSGDINEMNAQLTEQISLLSGKRRDDMIALRTAQEKVRQAESRIAELTVKIEEGEEKYRQMHRLNKALSKRMRELGEMFIDNEGNLSESPPLLNDTEEEE